MKFCTLKQPTFSHVLGPKQCCRTYSAGAFYKLGRATVQAHVHKEIHLLVHELVNYRKFEQA